MRPANQPLSVSGLLSFHTETVRRLICNVCLGNNTHLLYVKYIYRKAMAIKKKKTNKIHNYWATKKKKHIFESTVNLLFIYIFIHAEDTIYSFLTSIIKTETKKAWKYVMHLPQDM